MASTTYSSLLGGSTTQGLVLERKRLDDTSQATVSDGDVKVVAACFERHLRRLLDQHAFATLRESEPKNLRRAGLVSRQAARCGPRKATETRSR